MPISQSPGRSETGRSKGPFIKKRIYKVARRLNRLLEDLFHPLCHDVYLIRPEQNHADGQLIMTATRHNARVTFLQGFQHFFGSDLHPLTIPVDTEAWECIRRSGIDHYLRCEGRYGRQPGCNMSCSFEPFIP